MRECSNPSGARQDVKAKLRTTREGTATERFKARQQRDCVHRNVTQGHNEIGEDPGARIVIF